MKNTNSRLLFAAMITLAGAAASDVSAQADNFAEATIITTLPVNGTNTGATKETGEPNHGSNAGGSSVWYSWTALADGHYRVDLAGSSFDTLLAVYTGSAMASLLPVTQNDDRATGQLQSTVVIYAKAGQQFYIAVDGYRSTAAASGTIQLNISPLTAAEVPPANDLFANAANLGSITSVQVTASTANGSREAEEPRIAGITGATSLWWKWTAPATGEVEVSTAGTAFNTTLAVYTGTALNALTLVGANDNDGSLVTSRVAFSADAGASYYITADVSNTAVTIPVGNLTLRVVSNAFIRTLIPARSTWSWLHPQGGVDPAGTDVDFNITWQKAAGYDGPVFNTAAPAILGYGAIDYGAIATSIVDPGTGNRYTAYFRREIVAADNIAVLKAEVLADDGAVIYVDGVERGRVNMDPLTPDTFTALALDADATETTAVTVELGTLTAGAHEIAVSVHNSATSSSDLGFDLRLYGDATPPPPDFIFGPSGAVTGFEEPVVGSSTYLFGSNGTAELGWTSSSGVVRAPANHPAGAGTVPTNQYFALNSTRANPFRSDRISLANVSAEDKGRLVASAAVRTFTTSTTGFETADDLKISLEGSTDGTTFTVLADILPLTAGGTPDALFDISAATGDFVTFSTMAGAVTPNIAWLRLTMTGGSDSTSEYIYVDNLRVVIGSGVDPAADSDGDGQSNAAEALAGTDPNNPNSVLTVTAVTIAAGTLDFTFAAVSGKVYQLEYSNDLTIWSVLGTDIIAAATGPQSVPGVVLPSGTIGFVRVKVKP